MIIGGPLFAIFGTSITRQNSISTLPPNNFPAQAWFSDGYASWLRVLSGQRINLPASMNFGVSGNTFAQMLARIGDVINAQPQYCVVEGGTNDFPINTFATIQNNWLSIVSQLLAANIQLIIVPAPPRGDGVLTTAQVRLQQRFYNFQREYCRSKPGIVFCDYIGTWADQTSSISAPLPGRTRPDNVHPAAIGAYHIGRALADIISQIFPPSPTVMLPAADIYDAANNPTGNILYTGSSNLGILAGTGGTTVASPGLTYVNNGYAAGATFVRDNATSPCVVTLSKENPRVDTGRLSGERQVTQIVASSGGGADEVYSHRWQISLGDVAAGDWYYAECSVEISGAPVNVNSLEIFLNEFRPSNSQASLDMMLNSVTTKLPNVAWSGVLRTEKIQRQSDTLAIQVNIRARLDTTSAASITFKMGDVVIRKQLL
ncbi:hypothetical protein G6K93_30620 [Agrobacterium rhizogenes]|nr:hypothetical protein [Rhizobium rhizogenes]